MNDAELGAKYFVSAANGLQAVVPMPSGLSGPRHRNAAPPHSCTSIPRCALYQAPRAFGSLDLKKTPPIPVTRFMMSHPSWRWAGAAGPFVRAAADQQTNRQSYASQPRVEAKRL